ncbi:PQQ-dependent sugar dehydrogenase [Coralloluteibacterium thermophilus]|uniref:PQQ-dependent sugar dehydrogenase n=1 Tax=Coralloluteibacterium thermophilum TaxID=2707049 RepID=A0ABV9NPZ4_9GAMM
MTRFLLTLSLTALFAIASVARAEYRVETVAEGLEHPWSLAFLPDGRMLVTERPGRLRVIENGQLREAPVEGVPPVLDAQQSGLLEVLPAPDFAETGTLFLSYVHGDRRANHTRLARARFDGERLHDVQPIFTTMPAKSGAVHGGGRLLLLSDGTLLMSMGDGFFFREESQKLDSHIGTVVRINTDGSVPEDNPFVGRADVLPEIYSYGHRHIQALVYDPATQRIYSHEHGPRGGDELNVLQPGGNYGWPLVSEGRDYSRALITPFTRMPGMIDPLLVWTPSIAPAGMALYDGDLFPQWRGDLFVAALAEKTIRRVSMSEDGTPGEQEIMLADLGERMRDVRVGPDGALYVLTDEEDGRLLRIVPR